MATEVTELKRRATMINDKVRMYLLPPLINAAVRAGASIMNVYKNLDDYDISLKDDKTPITLADRLAHKTIREYLGPTRIPILSEEGREMLYDERRNWELYWLAFAAAAGGNIVFRVTLRAIFKTETEVTLFAMTVVIFKPSLTATTKVFNQCPVGGRFPPCR